jgi:hypothetical protein
LNEFNAEVQSINAGINGTNTDLELPQVTPYRRQRANTADASHQYGQPTFQ